MREIPAVDRRTIDRLAANLALVFPVVDVFLPGGNRGDGLIYAGAHVIFKKHGLATACFTRQNRPPKKSEILLILGSGGFSRQYNRMVRIVPELARHYRDVVIFPSTFDVNFEPVRRFLQCLPLNVLVFAREWRSYEGVKQLVSHDSLSLDHDTALNFDYAPWVVRNPVGETLLAFRQDRERDLTSAPKGNIDVSAGRYSEWRVLLERISGFSVVHTNRAHVSIAAAMLGKETHIYASSYFKQHEIYRFSLAHLKHVCFHHQPFSQGQSPIR